MHKTSILLALLFPFLCFSQNNSKFGRTYSDTLPDNFKLSSSQLREHIYNGIPAKIKNELYPRSAFRFADQSAVQLSYLFSSGTVYSDWPAMEKYANYVLKKVMPRELEKDSVIHLYLVKDGSYNAFMTPFGILFVNIGLIDEVDTEAALAAVLTHELAHYYLRHSLNRYVKESRGDFERVFSRSKHSKFSVQNELQADSLAIIWMNQSGYGIKGIDDAFKTMQRLENRVLLHYEDIWEVTESTHPASQRRSAQVDSFYQKNLENLGSDFLVSMNSFFKFKELAKAEILKQLLYDFQYDACIEKAFKFHLLDPNNPLYVYYLMEGIRRKCYFNTDYWKKNFITDSYYKVIESKNGHRKEKMTDHIFKNMPVEILCLSPEELNNVQAKFYWEGPPKFTTYEEAFNFFYQVGDLFNEPECILSYALSLNFDPKARDILLKKYLSKENIQFRDFATNLLNGTVQTSLPDKTLTVLSDFYATVRQGDEEIYIRNEKLVGDNNLTPILEAAVAGFDRRRYLNLSEIQSRQINDYIMFQELEQLSLMKFIAKGEKTELHILDPRYWQMMQKYQVNELEFIDFSYYDARKADQGLDAYKEVIQSNFNSLLEEEKRYRYIETRISSIREMPDGVMKVHSYGAEEKIAYNKPGKESVIEYINTNLKLKDKVAKDMDTAYKNSKH